MESPYTKKSITKTQIIIIAVLGILALIMWIWVISLMDFQPTYLQYDVRFNAFYVCDPNTTDSITEYEVLSSISPTDTIYVCANITNLTPEARMNMHIRLVTDEGGRTIAYKNQILDMEQGTFITPLENLSLTSGEYRIEARRGRILLAESHLQVVP